MNSNWPKSLDEGLILMKNEEKLYKAQAIVELILEDDLANKRFLNIESERTFITSYANNTAKTSINFNATSEEWTLHTNNQIRIIAYQEVKKYAPFDIVLLYDVLDHITKPTNLLNEVCSLTNFNSKIYIRTHPWNSRHATHDARNLAYIHLLEPYGGIYHNKNDNDHLIETTFNVVKKREIKEEIEPFFFNISFNEAPSETQFTDYIVQRKFKLL